MSIRETFRLLSARSCNNSSRRCHMQGSNDSVGTEGASFKCAQKWSRQPPPPFQWFGSCPTKQNLWHSCSCSYFDNSRGQIKNLNQLNLFNRSRIHKIYNFLNNAWLFPTSFFPSKYPRLKYHNEWSEQQMRKKIHRKWFLFVCLFISIEIKDDERMGTKTTGNEMPEWEKKRNVIIITEVTKLHVVYMRI